MNMHGIASSTYNVYRSCLNGPSPVGSPEHALEELRIDQREDWIRLAESMGDNFPKLQGRGWHEVTEMVYNGLWQTETFSGLPLRQQLAFEACLRHLLGCYTEGDDDDGPSDRELSEAPAIWRQWVQDRLDEEPAAEVAVPDPLG